MGIWNLLYTRPAKAKTSLHNRTVSSAAFLHARTHARAYARTHTQTRDESSDQTFDIGHAQSRGIGAHVLLNSHYTIMSLPDQNGRSIIYRYKHI